ncbi:head-tail adaptor protein [Lacunimicrobium album]
MNDSRLLKIVVEIWKYTTTDDHGVHKKDYTLSATRRAGVISHSADEIMQSSNNKKAMSTITYLFRYPIDINEKDQLRIGSRKLEVLSIINVNEQNRWLHVTATEVK